MKTGFTFIKHKDYENSYCKSIITYDVPNSDINWKDLLQEFIYFLSGCSYQIDADGQWITEKELKQQVATQHNKALEDLIELLIAEGRENELLTHPNFNIREVTKNVQQQKRKQDIPF